MSDAPAGVGASTGIDSPPSDRARARLLEMTYSRVVFSVNAIPFVGVPFVIWYEALGQDIRWVLAWNVGYAMAAIAVRLQRRRFLRDRATLDDAYMVARWLPVVNTMAIVHGICLALLMVVTHPGAPFEYVLLMHVSLAAIVAANATHQTPVLGVFQRFFVGCWGLLTAMTPWTYPAHWTLTLPLSVLYAVAIYRHGLVAHRFFLQQIRLEEDGIRLAEQYRAAKEDAEHALHAKNLFLTTASHDLRQPVHAMGFLIEAIIHRNRDASLTPALADLRRSVRSVHLMFNSLLDLSKIESGVVGARRVPVAIGPIMGEVAALFREEARSRGLDLRVRAPCTGGAVAGDAGLLRQSLINLTHNALRYTQRGGVLISARRRGADWLLEVWDTGIGVADQEQTRIYSPFYRNEFAWRRDSAGHGLGLAVVARCATLMGATYGLTSIEGRGSRFWMRIAAANPAEAHMAAAARMAPVDSQGVEAVFAPMAGACLIVEDDPMVGGAWCSLMQAWGIEARCVASAGEAFAEIEAGFAPLAILCDQRLRSGESGFEILKALLARCPEASGAMVSGEFASSALREAEQEGYLVLHKPLEAAQLHMLLSRWLSSPVA